jgi:hypothetical protein
MADVVKVLGDGLIDTLIATLSLCTALAFIHNGLRNQAGWRRVTSPNKKPRRN